jgi:hypothetical protein
MPSPRASFSTAFADASMWSHTSHTSLTRAACSILTTHLLRRLLIFALSSALYMSHPDNMNAATVAISRRGFFIFMDNGNFPERAFAARLARFKFLHSGL